MYQSRNVVLGVCRRKSEAPSWKRGVCRAPRLILVMLSLVVIGFPVHAEEFSTMVSTVFQLGDADSVVTARRIARQTLIEQAASKAGVYVDGTVTLEGEELSETIRQTSASIVRLEDEQEKLTGSEGDRHLLMWAHAHVDIRELRRRVTAMRNDRSKAARIEALSKENRRLREELATLGTEVRSAAGAGAAERVEELLSAMGRNYTQIGQTFERGSLLEMARSQGAASNKEADIILREIPRVYADGQIAASRIVAGDVYVTVKLTFAGFDRLRRYMNVGKTDLGIMVANEMRDPGTPIGSVIHYPSSPDLLNALAHRGAYIAVRLGGHEVKYPGVYSVSKNKGCNFALRDDKPGRDTSWRTSPEEFYARSPERLRAIPNMDWICIEASGTEDIVFRLSQAEAAKINDLDVEVVEVDFTPG